MNIRLKNMFNLLFCILVVLSFFEIPYIVNFYPQIATFYKLLKIGLFFISIGILLFQNKINRFIIQLTFFLLVLIFSSFLNKVAFKDSLYFSIQLFSMCTIFDYEFKVSSKMFFNVLITVLFIYFIINFLSILIYPNGMYINSTGYSKNWFLGYKNTQILYIFPLNLLIFMRTIKKYGKIKFHCYFILVLSIISSILVNNSTAIISLVMVFLFVIFKLYDRKIFNIRNLLLITIVLFLLIVVFRFQNVFSFLLVDMLRKDITFTGRTYIWDAVINKICSRPLLGYGLFPFVYARLGVFPIYSTHSFFLDIVYKSGIVGTLVFLSMSYTCFKKIYISRKYLESKILTVFIFAFSIMLLVEAYPYIYVFYLFAISYNCFSMIGGDLYENK